MRTLAKADLERLDVFLCGLPDDAMLLSELDGYLAGVLVCPELIMPGEWLSPIWGEDVAGFVNQAEAGEILEIVMALYNHIGRSLERPGQYVPHLESDVDGSFLWEFWAQGFGKALDLRPEAWALHAAMPDDDASVSALRTLGALAHAAETNRKLPEDLYRSLRVEAQDLLRECVEDLHRARLAAEGGSPKIKAGRNDPCPCGSGKKYKKCCLI
jgi:uncharacterized protein